MNSEPVLTPTHLVAIKRELFRICEKMLRVTSKYERELTKKASISELYDPLLDIYTELK